MWQPSSIPITSVHSPTTLSSYSRSSSVNYTYAAIDCLEVLSNQTITDNCGSLPSAIKDHLLEACIREHLRIGANESQNMLLHSLIYYCATAMGVDECKFDGYFYFCDEEETNDSAFPIAIIAGAAGALLLLLAIIVIVLIRKKMKNKKEAEERDLDQHYQMLHNANTNTRFNKSRLGMYDQKETSFSRRTSKVSDGRGSSAWSHDGRDSVCSETSIGSRFFESPIMFMGDAPSETHDRIMSPSSSRGFSPLSFFNKKQSVAPHSITVAPPARDVPEKFKSKQDFTNVKTEGKNTFSSVSKLIEKARKDNECTSPHPAPASDAPGPRRVSSPTSPSSSGFFSHTSPKQPASTPTSPISPTPSSGGFFGRNNSQATPLPGAEPNAPTSIFGNNRGTPKPSFDAPTTLSGNRSTPKPKFGADPLSSPSPVGEEMPTPWKKPVAIPRLPGPLNVGNRRKSASTKEDKQHMMDDLDMM